MVFFIFNFPSTVFISICELDTVSINLSKLNGTIVSITSRAAVIGAAVGINDACASPASNVVVVSVIFSVVGAAVGINDASASPASNAVVVVSVIPAVMGAAVGINDASASPASMVVVSVILAVVDAVCVNDAKALPAPPMRLLYP